jgi:secreted trypsin-like serine protease
MRTRLLVVLMTALATLGMQSPATASTGGTADGNAHPNVGILFAYSDGVRFRCSGTLVSPTVVLTAGHCTDGVDGKVLISFDSVIAETKEDFDYPVAANPDAGYTAAELAAAGFASGTAYTHPQYSGLTDLKNWNDVGVVELDEPITSIAPAAIAPIGTLDGIAKLTKTVFTAVGYGTEVRQPDSGPQKAVPENFPLLRRFVQVPGQKLTPQVIQTGANPNENQGTGGTCTGDSGGPLFYNGVIVAVTSYGNNDKCLGVGGYQRVDITAAQDWLDEFGL